MRPVVHLVFALVLSSLLQGCVAVSFFRHTPLPEGARVLRDVPYHVGTDFDDEKHRMNVFIPPGDGPHPVIVFAHGGGWWFGDRNAHFKLYDRLGARLAKRGILTVVPSYRLTPPYKHPAHIVDVSRAIAWTVRNISGHGGDPQRVFAMGHSAGAQLVALAAMDRRWLREVGLTPDAMKGVIPISGPYDVTRLGRALFFGGALMVHPAFGTRRQLWSEVSPLKYLRRSEPPPPFLCLWADGDPAMLRDDSARFAQALSRAGVPVEEHVATFKGHISVIMDLADEGDELGDAIEEYVKRR